MEQLYVYPHGNEKWDEAERRFIADIILYTLMNCYGHYGKLMWPVMWYSRHVARYADDLLLLISMVLTC